MSKHGYLNHSLADKRDEEAIRAIFAVLPCECVAMEQMWSPGERKRPVFTKLMSRIRPGDTLYVHSIDRLGVDVKETVKVWRTITKDKRADIIVLNDPVLNSRDNSALTLAQIRQAAQLAFDGAARFEQEHSRLFTAFELTEFGTEAHAK